MKKQSCRLLVVFAWMIAGCAPTQRVDSVSENPLLADRAYAKILVVGAHADVERRRRFENDVVRSFAAQGVGAVSILTTRGGDQTINRDVLVMAARDTASDAVLITRLVDAQSRGENGTTISTERSNDEALADYFRGDYADYRDPMAIDTVTAVRVASDLYDVTSEKRVWSGQSAAFPKNTADTAISPAADAVTRTLRAGGWLD